MTKVKTIGLAKASMPAMGTDAHYQAKDDMETLRRAEEIRMDRPRHRAATGMAKMHMKELMKVTGRKK